MAIATKQIIDNMKKYESHIRNQVPGGVAPVRHDFTGHDLKKNMEHALFMTMEIREQCNSLFEIQINPGSADYWKNQAKYHSTREKIMRWLGWLQCSMCFFGLYSLEDLKKDNMPPGTEYRPDGGSPQLAKTEQSIEATGRADVATRASHIRTILAGLPDEEKKAILDEVGVCHYCGGSDGMRCNCMRDD